MNTLQDVSIVIYSDCIIKEYNSGNLARKIALFLLTEKAKSTLPKLKESENVKVVAMENDVKGEAKQKMIDFIKRNQLSMETIVIN